MVWIVTGAHGQLGTALCRLAPERMHGLTHADLDITNPKQIGDVLNRLRPEGVINTAAYNFVDQAESERETAFQINSFGPMTLAHECESRNLPLVHLSTDYVFRGCSEKAIGLSETDPLKLPILSPETMLHPPARDIYALSKSLGEETVRLSEARHFIIRTCGIYGRARTAGKGNFVETMLRLGKERGEVRVVTDQRCTPTSAVDLATGILKLIDTQAYGLYHLTNGGSCTWFEFAEEIFRQAGLSVKMTGITTEEFGAAAERPRFSVLDCRKFMAATGWTPPTWQEALRVYLAERA